MILYFNSNSSLAKSIIQNQVYLEACLSNITQTPTWRVQKFILLTLKHNFNKTTDVWLL
jgi:hypothetical protein